MKSRFATLILAWCCFSGVLTAQTTNRSAVSVNGTDTASCTVPDPCRTFAIALSKTNSGGEVLALTSGGYGRFDIDRPVSIIVPPGVYAGLVSTLGNAINVNAGAGAKVVIRGLTFNGFGAGAYAIAIDGSAAVTHVENCVIDGFNHGVFATLDFTLSDTTIRHCEVGVRLDNPSGLARATVERVNIEKSGFEGLLAWRNAVVVARDVSSVGDGSTLSGFRALGGGPSDPSAGNLTLENCLAARNSSVGIYAEGGVIRISNCVSVDNAFGLVNSGGVMESWGNNRVRGNGTNTLGSITNLSQN